MADKIAKYPVGAQMLYPDGSMYLYAQSADNFEKGTYIEFNANERLCKFKGGFRFPPGIIIEPVAKEEYTFILIRPPQEQKQTPIVG